jgi:hypothetical protein
MNGSKSRVLRGLFVGEQGLRAGWSVLIFLAIVVVLSVLGGKLAGHFFPDKDMHVVSPQILTEATLLLALFIATWVMSKIEKRPVLSYGLTDSRMVRRFFFGLAVGLLSISALVGALWTTHLLVFDGRVLSGAAIWKYAALWAALRIIWRRARPQPGRIPRRVVADRLALVGDRHAYRDELGGIVSVRRDRQWFVIAGGVTRESSRWSADMERRYDGARG